MSIWQVGNALALNQTLATAQSGDTILLAAGIYSGVVIDGRAYAGGGVTIKSADPGQPAVFPNLIVRSSEGLTFSDLEFAIDPAKGDNPIQILSSKNVHMTGIDVHGSLNNDPSDDKAAIFIRNSSNVSISNSEFHQLWIGVGFLDSNVVRILNNDFHDIRMDGVRGGGVSNLEVSGNSFTDFYPVGDDHPDAIQLWTVNTTASAHDIVITNNLITRGAGATIQGIFLRDESEVLPYLNVTIKGNVIAGTGYNGIALMGAKDFAISDNTVVGYSDYQSWIRVENATGGVLSNNETELFILTKSTGFVETGNRLIAPVSTAAAKALDAWLVSHAGDLNLPASLGLPFSGAPGVVEKLFGTDGDDILQSAGAGDVWIEAGAGNDVVNGGVGQGYLRGGDGDDLIIGGSSFDDMHGNQGNDSMRGGDGDDWVVGGQDNDSLLGERGFDVVYGNLGNDTLDGGDGGDWVRGGQGDDVLRGGEGNDFMSGDRGADTISGGTGADGFNFFPGAGLDWVTDFSIAEGDVVRLAAGTTYTLQRVGADMVIRLASGEEMVLVGVHEASPTPGWIVTA